MRKNKTVDDMNALRRRLNALETDLDAMKRLASPNQNTLDVLRKKIRDTKDMIAMLGGDLEKV